MVHCKTASPVLQITKLVYEVSEEDVVRARNQLKASILFSMDGSGGTSPCCGQLATMSSTLCDVQTSCVHHETRSRPPACMSAI